MSQLRATYALCALLCLPTAAFAQANGKLQIHYIDVGQGEADRGAGDYADSAAAVEHDRFWE